MKQTAFREAYWFQPTGWNVWQPTANSPSSVMVTKYSRALAAVPLLKCPVLLVLVALGSPVLVVLALLDWVVAAITAGDRACISMQKNKLYVRVNCTSGAAPLQQ